MSDSHNRSPVFDVMARRIRNWGRWGSGDELGTLNFISSAHRVRAAALVRTGNVFDLAMALDENGPQHGQDARFNPIHRMTIMPDDGRLEGNGFWVDDTIFMPLQCATQWDALSHIGYDGYFYNGVHRSCVTDNGASRNAISNVSGRLIGRGVLLDIARLRGCSCLPGGYEITASDLTLASQVQGVEVGTGDILLIRTGWYARFERGDHAGYLRPPVPGIGISVCEWLFQREVAVVASDTHTVEVLPSKVEGVELPIHMLLIRDAGMMLGEMFNLEELATDCDRDGRWEFFLSALPLKFTKAVGSPVSPVAVK